MADKPPATQGKAVKDLITSQAGNLIVPNSFQTPNFIIDFLWFYLTDVEKDCLIFAVRRILGFQNNIRSRKDRISLSQFVNGLVSKKGETLSLGTGRSKEAILKALEGLEQYRVLVKVGGPNGNGQTYQLAGHSDEIDWDGLTARRGERRAVNQKRTKAAREVGGEPKPQAEMKAKKPNPVWVMGLALAEVTGEDFKLNQGKLLNQAKRLVDAGYTPEKVKAIFSRGGAWYRKDWRGKKGQRPNVSNVLQSIAQLAEDAVSANVEGYEEEWRKKALLVSAQMEEASRV